MGRVRPIAERADEAEARLRIERARLELERTKAARKAVKARDAALSTYRAAVKDRTTRDWNARTTSADSAILPDRATLDARARQMARDDPYAKSVVRAYKRNVVGTGITPAAAARDIDGNALLRFNRTADALWFDWSRDPRRCDIERRRSFSGIQRWAVSEFVQTGDAIVVMSIKPDRSGRPSLVLQLVESEQLDRYKLSVKDPQSGVEREVRGGVEVDEFGAAVAYWIYERHPNDVVGFGRPTPMTLESVRIPAERVCHVVDAERARQTRGVTTLASCMSKLRDLGEYDYAHLQAARAEACIGVLITAEADSHSSLGLNQPTSEGAAQRSDTDGNNELAFQPMMAARLSPGEDVKPFTPARPGGTYQPFMETSLRAIAAASGVSYEQVARDFTGGTYSSQRQAMLEDERELAPIQELIVTQLCQPVWEAFVELQVLTGRLVAPRFAVDRDLWVYAEWRPPARPWIDPEKEVNAHEKALAIGLDTKRRILLERQMDWREVAEQRADETAYEAALAAPAPAAAPAAPSPQAPETGAPVGGPSPAAQLPPGREPGATDAAMTPQGSAA